MYAMEYALYFVNVVKLLLLLFFVGIRILVTLLLDTLPMLGNVLLLSFLIFFVFGIIGVQLWQGKLRNRCFTNFSKAAFFFTR